MFDATIPAQAAAWLLTYALHSTLFLGLAWLAARRLRKMPAVEEAVWRFALVAGLVTASIQLASGREPLAGRWNLAAAQDAPAVSASVATPAPVRLADAAPRALPRTAQRIAPPEPVTKQGESFRLSIPASLPLWVAGLWAAGALLLGSRWLIARVRLHRRLRARPVVVEAAMVDLLDGLVEKAGLREPVRLTCSSRLPVPVALGVHRPEICVPPRALAALAPEQQEGMLAHELAHLVRRDPFWLGFGQLLTSLFFFQPLAWIAVNRLREISEMRCDEWAVSRTGRPVSLARCLAEVAGWSFQPLGALPAPSMADRPSHLAQRIRHLLDNRSPERRVHPLWLTLGMAALLIAGVAAAPGVAAAVAGEKAPEAESAPVLAQASAPAPSPRSAPASIDDADDTDEADLDDPVDPEDLEDLEALEDLEDLKDLEDLGDLDLDIDLDDAGLDVLDEDLDQLLEASSQLAANLAADLSGDFSGNGETGSPMTEEEAEAFAERMEEMGERIADQIDREMKPRMKQMEKQLEMSLSRFAESDEMRRLEREAERIAERARPSEEEMDRLEAEIEKLRADGGLSEEDKRTIREDARRMAEKHRLSDQDRAEIDRIQSQARELAERSMRENHVEIDQMRQQILQESEAIREQVRRQIENDPEMRKLREKAREDRRREERDERREERAPRPPKGERQVHHSVAPAPQPPVR